MAEIFKRVLRRPLVEVKTGLSRSSIYARLDPKSPLYDPSFPRPVSIGARAVGWLNHEVDQWIEERSRQSVSAHEGGSHE